MKLSKRKVSAFFLAPILGMMAPVLTLPILSRLAGESGWPSVVVAQAIGGAAATVILFGWSSLGPVRISQTNTRALQTETVRESYAMRGLVALPVVPLASLAAVTLAAPGFRVEAGALAFSGAILGFSPAWFAVATNQPRIILGFDVFPRIVAAVLGVIVLLAAEDIVLFAIVSSAVLLISISLFALLERVVPRRGHRISLRNISEHLPLALTALVGSGYSAGPVAIAALLLDDRSASALSSTDKLYRISLFAIVALANALQSWVLDARSDRPRRRSRAMQFHLALGILGSASIYFMGPFIGALIFSTDLAPTGQLSLIYGLSFLILSVSTPLIRNLLVPAGLRYSVLWASVWGVIVGLPAMYFLGKFLGSNGVAIGFLISELVVLFCLLVMAFVLRNRGRPGNPH